VEIPQSRAKAAIARPCVDILMEQSKSLSLVLPVVVALLAATSCRGERLNPISHCLEAPYSNPPTSFQASDLAGTWETRYGRNVDRLIFKEDGTFKQIYENHYVEDYAYETPWNEWWMERFPDGRVRVHLQGARYYVEGIEVAERNGMHPPCPQDQPNCWGVLGPPPRGFYDPVADERVHMVGGLVLNVRGDSAGKLLLLHMWLARDDEAFAMIDCERDQFRRVQTP